MGGTAGSSGSGTGSTANVYTPVAQGAADTRFQDILSGFPSTAAATPAGVGYQNATNWLTNLMDSPYIKTALDTAALANTYEAGTAFPQATGAASQLYGAGSQVLNTAFDPEGGLYRAGQGNALDYANVTNAMSGVGSSPYGSRVAADALSNYDLNWQDRQLKRQEGGLTAARLADTEAAALNTGALKDYAAYGALPYTEQAGITGDILGDTAKTAALGTSSYALPQQVIQDLESYLRLGQSASTISGDLGQKGFDQTASAIGGGLSGLNSLFGSGGIFGSGSGASSGGGLLSGLFGSGASAGVDNLTGAAALPGFDTLGGTVGMGALGGDFGGGGKAAASMLGLSDRRLKSDIEKLGEIRPGLNLYSFRYADPTVRIGLMADEVERFNPDAVYTLPGGFKAVDYARALE